jgi:hypothetical protein
MAAQKEPLQHSSISILKDSAILLAATTAILYLFGKMSYTFRSLFSRVPLAFRVDIPFEQNVYMGALLVLPAAAIFCVVMDYDAR